jgi:hypothetical protein
VSSICVHSGGIVSWPSYTYHVCANFNIYLDKPNLLTACQVAAADPKPVMDSILIGILDVIAECISGAVESYPVMHEWQCFDPMLMALDFLNPAVQSRLMDVLVLIPRLTDVIPFSSLTYMGFLLQSDLKSRTVLSIIDASMHLVEFNAKFKALLQQAGFLDMLLLLLQVKAEVLVLEDSTLSPSSRFSPSKVNGGMKASSLSLEAFDL